MYIKFLSTLWWVALQLYRIAKKTVLDLWINRLAHNHDDGKLKLPPMTTSIQKRRKPAYINGGCMYFRNMVYLRFQHENTAKSRMSLNKKAAGRRSK